MDSGPDGKRKNTVSDTTPRRGRPKATDPTTQHQLRLTDATWAALDAIARREGLDYGGLPSRARAVVWLVDRDRESQGQ